jgi:hypothetical protein
VYTFRWLRDVTTLRIKNFKKSDTLEINFYYAKSIHVFVNATENWRILYLHNGELDNINKYYQLLLRQEKQENGTGGEVSACMGEMKTGYNNLW